MATTQQTETKPRRRALPACSITEEEGRVMLALEIPGVEKDNVSISVENDELKISATKTLPNRESTFLLRERPVVDYYSSYTIDETIDRDRIEAQTSLGVLTITLHLKEAQKPRQITVKEVS